MLSKIIQGVQHVDDALILSNTHCAPCLVKCIAKLWPKDCGVSLEESGKRIRFLQVNVCIPDPKISAVIVTPFEPNLCFARGTSRYQAVARI